MRQLKEIPKISDLSGKLGKFYRDFRSNLNTIASLNESLTSECISNLRRSVRLVKKVEKKIAEPPFTVAGCSNDLAESREACRIVQGMISQILQNDPKLAEKDKKALSITLVPLYSLLEDFDRFLRSYLDIERQLLEEERRQNTDAVMYSKARNLTHSLHTLSADLENGGGTGVPSLIRLVSLLNSRVFNLFNIPKKQVFKIVDKLEQVNIQLSSYAQNKNVDLETIVSFTLESAFLLARTEIGSPKEQEQSNKEMTGPQKDRHNQELAFIEILIQLNDPQGEDLPLKHLLEDKREEFNKNAHRKKSADAWRRQYFRLKKRLLPLALLQRMPYDKPTLSGRPF